MVLFTLNHCIHTTMSLPQTITPIKHYESIPSNAEVRGRVSVFLDL